MTVKEIIAQYLAANGFGGLHNDDCGCFDNDLFPCDGPCESCEPAYKVPAHCDTCETGCEASDTAAVWCLTTVKPAPEIAEAVANGPTTTQGREICPHYYEATDGVHVVVVGRCNCAGKLSPVA